MRTPTILASLYELTLEGVDISYEKKERYVETFLNTPLGFFGSRIAIFGKINEIFPTEFPEIYNYKISSYGREMILEIRKENIHNNKPGLDHFIAICKVKASDELDFDFNFNLKVESFKKTTWEEINSIGMIYLKGIVRRANIIRAWDSGIYNDKLKGMDEAFSEMCFRAKSNLNYLFSPKECMEILKKLLFFHQN